MTIRCDHCCGSLGLIIHRYWRMRFCSANCLQAYQHRLQRSSIRLKLFGAGARSEEAAQITNFQ
jgi:hypothetical protein